MNKVSVIASLVPFFFQINTQKTLFKKTASEFKRKYKIDLSDAPVVFKKDGVLWKLQYCSDVFRGKKFETATYIPMVGVGDKYESLLRTDINV